MKYLLDTHAFLWYLQGDTNLARKAKNIIDAKENLGSPVLMVKIPVFLIASSKM
ncbi:MAG: type II toxin-antitoxin system VapC family toxin, partial [Symploca sp. SIO3E6]|nr:type II toxin-antitoxin system VapC family toxin [Caldora sp. SIO3E6]